MPFSVAFFFFLGAGARLVTSRSTLGVEAKVRGNGVLFLATAFSWLALGALTVATTFAVSPSAAFAQRSNPATEDAEREPARRFDLLRRDALGVQTRYPAVAKIVGRDAPQTREDGSQTIPLYYGTGTFVAELGEWGIVLSNWHVVSEARDSIVAKFPTFSSPARVILRDETWDLAALVVRKPPRVAPIPISQEVPNVGDALWVAGYGESAGLTEFQIQGGRVQNYALLVADEDETDAGSDAGASLSDDAGKLTNGVAPSAGVAQLAASRPENALLYETLAVDKGVRKGDSGGPIFNRYGELAGVLWGSNGESTMGTYCIRAQYFLTQAIQRLAALEAERLLDAPTSDLLAWRPELGVADAEGTSLWARAALETLGVYPIAQRPVYVAADGRETPENLRRFGVEAATKRVRTALVVAEKATATALPPSPPVFSPTFVSRQETQGCDRPDVVELGFWPLLVDSERAALLASRASGTKVRETSVVDEADATANVALAVAAESANNADFADEPSTFGVAKGLGGAPNSKALRAPAWEVDDPNGETAVSLRKPVGTENGEIGGETRPSESDAARQESADWESDEETSGAVKTENREDGEASAVSEEESDAEQTSVSENEQGKKDDAKGKKEEKRVNINGFYLNDLQVYLIICAIFCLFYNAARLITDADVKKERPKRPRESQGRAPDRRDV